MIAASAELIALLNLDQFMMADLLTITTKAGQVLRYTSADVDIYQESSTNLMKHSEDFSNSVWTTNTYSGTGAIPVKTPNYALAPDGTMTACRIQANRGAGSGGTDYSVVRQSGGAPGTRSVWIKSNTGVNQNVALGPNASLVVTATPEWAKVSCYSVSTPYFDIGSIGGVSSTNNVDVLVWHPQMEAKPYATAYIPTTSAPVTRPDYGPFSSSMKFKRGSTRQVRGLEVDDLSVTFFPESSDLIGTVPFLQAVGKGALDGADFKLERGFFYPDWRTLVGTIIRFMGRIEDIEDYTRTEIPCTVKSDLVLLNVQMPRNIYQPGCRRTLYDAGCGVNKASFGVAGTAQAGSTTAVINCGLAQAAGWFDLGTVTFSGGANAGVSRTVKSYTPGVLTFSLPLPYTPAPGDAFTAYAGCDKQQDTCNDKFSNLINFSGEPYIPAAETAY